MNNFRNYANSMWRLDGLSARTIFSVKYGFEEPCNYPHDPDDLCRCIQVLRRLFGTNEERIVAHLQKVAEQHRSDVWERYANNWIQLIELFHTEWEESTTKKKRTG